MNKKVIITALLALVVMAGQGQVQYRLEGFVGNSTITGKAYLMDISSATFDIRTHELVDKYTSLTFPNIAYRMEF